MILLFNFFLQRRELQRRELLTFCGRGAEVAGGDCRRVEEAKTAAGRRGVRTWTRMAEAMYATGSAGGGESEAMAATGRSTASRVRRREGYAEEHVDAEVDGPMTARRSRRSTVGLRSGRSVGSEWQRRDGPAAATARRSGSLTASI